MPEGRGNGWDGINPRPSKEDIAAAKKEAALDDAITPVGKAVGEDYPVIIDPKKVREVLLAEEASADEEDEEDEPTTWS